MAFMVKFDRLNEAIAKLEKKVNALEYKSGSSYEDITLGLLAYLQRYSASIERKGKKEDNGAVLLEYFSKVNNYLKIMNENPRFSKKERFGNIMGDNLDCALPEVRNMTPLDAKLLGFRNAKFGYITALTINANPSN